MWTLSVPNGVTISTIQAKRVPFVGYFVIGPLTMLRNFFCSCPATSRKTLQTFFFFGGGVNVLSSPLIFAVVPALVRRVEKKQVGARYGGQITKGGVQAS
jgi:hypothetical protein